MKRYKIIAAAFLVSVLSAAMALPALAAPEEVEVLIIDEPLNTEVSDPSGSSGASGSSGRVQEDVKPAQAETSGAATASPAAGQADESSASAQETVNLTTEQRQIILELVPDDLYRFYTSTLWDSVPETSVNIAALSAQDLVNELYGVLRNAGSSSAIFTPVGHAAQEGYSVWFDKDDALEKTAGLYGRSVTESNIAQYNDDWGGDMPDMIVIDGNAIASLNPEGEGKVRPSIESCVSDGDDIKVTLTFTATFDDAKNNGSGRATAIFTSAPESILGYRLKSIALN